MSHKFWLVVLGASVVAVLVWAGFLAPDALQAQSPPLPKASELHGPDVPRAAARDRSAGVSDHENTLDALDEQRSPSVITPR